MLVFALALRKAVLHLILRASGLTEDLEQITCITAIRPGLRG